jgi:hypothetical protein
VRDTKVGSGSIWFWRAANFGRSRLSGGQSRLKAGCGQDYLRHITKLTHYPKVRIRHDVPPNSLQNCAAELAAAECDDGIGAADGPEHSGLLDTLREALVRSDIIREAGSR